MKKVKSFENNHICEHPIAPTKKRRATAMEVLLSGGSGNRMRTGSSHDHPTPQVENDSHARAAQTDASYNKNINFNQVAFDDYVRVVLQCTEIAKTTISSDVKLEGPSVI